MRFLGAPFVKRPGMRIFLEIVVEPENILLLWDSRLVTHPPTYARPWSDALASPAPDQMASGIRRSLPESLLEK